MLEQIIGLFIRQTGVFSPCSDEIEEVLPTVADFVEFLIDLSRFALVTGSGQALSQLVQLQLVFFSHSDLLLIVLGHNTTQPKVFNAVA